MSNDLKVLLTDGRRLKNVTLREAERATGISNAYLSQLESGKVPEPSPRILYKLAEYYSISYSALMEAAGYVVPSQKNREGSTELLFRGEKLTPKEGVAMAAFLETYRRTETKRKK